MKRQFCNNDAQLIISYFVLPDFIAVYTCLDQSDALRKTFLLTGFHLSGVVTDDESHHNVYSSHR